MAATVMLLAPSLFVIGWTTTNGRRDGRTEGGRTTTTTTGWTTGRTDGHRTTTATTERTRLDEHGGTNGDRMDDDGTVDGAGSGQTDGRTTATGRTRGDGRYV